MADGSAHSTRTYRWDDPFDLDGRLTDDERMIRDAARTYARERLLPRVVVAFRDETFDRAIMTELGAMGFLYIMNITACLAQSIFLCYEKEFLTWARESKCHKCFYWVATLFSLIANHKFKNILFCKLFTFKFFSARLDRV